MERRVVVQWTTTAKEQLSRLPKNVRQGLLAKAGLLRQADDPTSPHKRLTGPLDGYFRVTYSRYRAVYTVDEEELPTGDSLVHIKVVFVAAGIRREHDRRDVYKVAKRLIEFGLVEKIAEAKPDDQEPLSD